MSETLLFLRQLASRPKQISAIAPSSRRLARAMARDLGPHTGRVVEFGPGTGRLTQGILDAGVKPADLTLFEMSADFTAHLRAGFPGVTVHNTGAQHAAQLVPKGAGAVISGLPLMSMPLDLREAIVRAAFDLLAPDGIYVQFTYGSKAQVPPDLQAKLGLTCRQTAYIWANLPPARVHTFRRA